MELSIRHRTTVEQKESEQLVPDIVSIVLFMEHACKKWNLCDGDIYTMDETAVWIDTNSNTTVDDKGGKSVTLKTTGHKKLRLAVILTICCVPGWSAQKERIKQEKGVE